jgi:hypothetical protein
VKQLIYFVWRKTMSGTSKGYSTTAGRLPLRINDLRKAGKLVEGNVWNWVWSREGQELASIMGRTEANRIILTYKTQREGGDWLDVCHAVWLARIDCNYGGQRLYFLCPGCGRRISVLYSSDSVFACRKCLRLNYACQRQRKADRCWRRAHKLRLRIGGDATLPAYHEKPKGMYWRTFERLRKEASYYDEMACRLVGV